MKKNLLLYIINKKVTYIKILDLLEVEKVTNKYNMYSFIDTYTRIRYLTTLIGM